MYARKDIPTVLPDAVLRCRKLQAAANVELDQMEKAKCRRINNLEWQEQTFQRTLTERHKRWRMYDRAFRLKLKRELGADFATALRLRTIQDEEEKFSFEQQLLQQSLTNKKNDESKNVKDTQRKSTPALVIKNISKSVSAYPKSDKTKASVGKGSQSAVDSRRVQSSATKGSRSTSAVTEAPKLSTRRQRTSRFHILTRRDSDPAIEHRHDFGSVLLRILSNIAATPDLDDDFVVRKRALEARERRLILTRDDRYHNLVKQLIPQKVLGEKDSDDTDNTDFEED